MSEQDTEQPFESPPGAHVDHRSMLVKAWQLIDGEYRCYCGEPAVMELRTQPDAEPGLVCKAHGLDWLGAVFRLYGADLVPPISCGGGRYGRVVPGECRLDRP